MFPQFPQFWRLSFFLSLCNFCHFSSSSFLGFNFAAQAFFPSFRNFGSQAFSTALQFLPLLLELFPRLSKFCGASVFFNFHNFGTQAFSSSCVIFAPLAFFLSFSVRNFAVQALFLSCSNFAILVFPSAFLFFPLPLFPQLSKF
jgi:hypothetical protein